jgi:hypothetical protein
VVGDHHRGISAAVVDGGMMTVESYVNPDEQRIELVASVLLQHDISADFKANTCICGHKLWQEGGPTLARHRAEVIVAAENELMAHQERERLQERLRHVMRLAQ